jgi:predicted DNA-binding protein YlxM (UPF0122 family)
MPKKSEQAQIEEYARLYESGLTFDQVGEKFGIQGKSVSNILKRHGFKMDRRYTLTNRQRTPSPRKLKLDPNMQADYDSGLSLPKLAKKYNVSVTTVARNVQTDPSRRFTSKPELAKEYWKLYQMGYSSLDIAEVYEVSEQSVCYLLKAHGYELRDLSEAMQLIKEPKRFTIYELKQKIRRS